MKTLFAILLISATVSTEWLTDFEMAKTKAAAENKFILLNFSGSDWCAPCIKLKKEVFENETFLSVAEEKLVLVRADFPRIKKNQLPKEQVNHNEALAERYNPNGKFPYTLLLDASGKVIRVWDGYVFATQDKFIEEVKSSVEGK